MVKHNQNLLVSETPAPSRKKDILSLLDIERKQFGYFTAITLPMILAACGGGGGGGGGAVTPTPTPEPTPEPTPDTSHSDITIASSATSANEGDTVTYTVTAGTVGNVDTEISWEVANGSSDFDSASGTVTLKADETSATFSLSVTNDTVSEDPETFTVTVDSVSETLSVSKSDYTASDISLSSSADSIDEGGEVTYTVTAGTAGDTDTTFEWSVTNANDDSDFSVITV